MMMLWPNKSLQQTVSPPLRYVKTSAEFKR